MHSCYRLHVSGTVFRRQENTNDTLGICHICSYFSVFRAIRHMYNQGCFFQTERFQYIVCCITVFIYVYQCRFLDLSFLICVYISIKKSLIAYSSSRQMSYVLKYFFGYITVDKFRLFMFVGMPNHTLSDYPGIYFMSLTLLLYSI